MMRTTISDIAKRAGVSKTTVSRVLNNKPDVDETTRQRILDIIRELDYVPNPTAVGLASGHAKLIGLLLPSLSRPYYLEIIRGVSERIEESEYELVLYTTTLDEKNQERFAKALSHSLADGLIVVLPRNGDHLIQMHDNQFPLVLIDYRGMSSGLPSVTATNFQGAYDGTRYLLELGHRHIGFITGLLDFGCSRNRLDGYYQAMQEANLDIFPDMIKEGDFSRMAGFNQTRQLLAMKPRPTAIFCSNDEMALGAFQAIQDAGLNAPADISIIGFDDAPMTGLITPALTTVRQPLREMGRKAVELVLHQIEGISPDLIEVELQTELVVRESCAPPSNK